MAVQSVRPVSPGQYTVGTLEKQFVRKSFAQNILKNEQKYTISSYFAHFLNIFCADDSLTNCLSSVPTLYWPGLTSQQLCTAMSCHTNFFWCVSWYSYLLTYATYTLIRSPSPHMATHGRAKRLASQSGSVHCRNTRETVCQKVIRTKYT